MASAAAAAAVASNVATRSLWSQVKSIPKEYPLAFGIVFSGFKTSFSDLLVQKVVEQREQIDWKRNAAFAAFGFVYLGGIQYCIYVPIFGRMFPTSKTFTSKPIREKMKDFRGMFECGAQVFIDQCVHHPLMYFPAFYMTKELVMRDKPDIGRALSEYRANMKEDLFALWKVWVPATLINFAFMPMWARIPTVATTSLLWTCILSAMRGGDVTGAQDMAGGSVTGATYHLMEEGFGSVFTQPAELEANKTHLMISAAGRDRKGVVAQLSRAVAEAGGSITHSRMTRLGADFIISLHAAVPPEKANDFKKALKANQDLEPFKLTFSGLTRRETAHTIPAQLGVRLRAVGRDRPGILAAISETLDSKGLSVESVSTDLQIHGGKGDDRYRRDFVIEADCIAHQHLDNAHVQSLVEDLNHLKGELKLDILDVRVQRLSKRRYSSVM